MKLIKNLVANLSEDDLHARFAVLRTEMRPVAHQSSGFCEVESGFTQASLGTKLLNSIKRTSDRIEVSGVNGGPNNATERIAGSAAADCEAPASLKWEAFFSRIAPCDRLGEILQRHANNPPAPVAPGAILHGSHIDHFAIAWESELEFDVEYAALLARYQIIEPKHVWPRDVPDCPMVDRADWKFMTSFWFRGTRLVLLSPYSKGDVMDKFIRHRGMADLHHVAMAVPDIEEAMRALHLAFPAARQITKLAQDEPLSQVFFELPNDPRILELVERNPSFEGTFTCRNVRQLTEGERHNSAWTQQVPAGENTVIEAYAPDRKAMVQKCESRYGFVVMQTPAELEAKPWLADGRTLIFADVLRNTTAITCALAGMAESVVLYGKDKDSLKQLRADADDYPGPKGMAGEVEGAPIPGFEFGNSPREFTPGRLAGKRIFYSSTNGGSGLCTVMRLARPSAVVLACLLNVEAIAEAIILGRLKPPFAFVCAGFRGSTALEDNFCAGRLLALLQRHEFDCGELDDDALTVLESSARFLSLNAEVRNLEELIVTIEHCRCGSVLKLFRQETDIIASITGEGLDSMILKTARQTIPIIVHPRASRPEIVRFSGGK